MIRTGSVLAALLMLELATPGAHAQDVCPNPVIDDSRVNIVTAADAATMRSSLIQYIWGQAQLPGDSNVTVIADAASPIPCSTNLARVDELRTVLGPTVGGTTMPARAYHFVPAFARNRLAIVHNGHMPEKQCTTQFVDAEDGLSPYGMQMTINALLAEGFDVLAISMPLFQPDDCSQDHNALLDPPNAPLAGGSGMRYFFDATLRSLNHLLQRQAFSDVSMMGLSGGGWTTTVYAAVDPRITLSFPVAGSLPLAMRNPTPARTPTQPMSHAMGVDIRAALRAGADPSPNVVACGEFGDRENSLPEFYQIAGYPDLYVLGAYGPGRSQVQILNRRDACCFGHAQHRDGAAYDSNLRGYERQVRSVLHGLGQGEFRLEVDEASSSHMISRNAVHNIILGEMGGAHRRVGANSAHAFKRGPNGALWHHAGHGWEDLGYPMVGAPAVLENALHEIDVFVRSDLGTPRHHYRDGGQWHVEALVTSNAAGETLPDGKIITDPEVIVRKPGQIEVIATGRDYRLYRWTVGSPAQAFDRPGGNGLAVGTPALARTPAGNLGVYYRSSASAVAPACIEQPRVLYQRVANGYREWGSESRIGGDLVGYPSAGGDEDAVRVLSLSRDGALREASSGDGTSWQWSTAVAEGAPFVGSPSRPLRGNVLSLFARGADDDLMRLLYDGEWRAETLDLAQTDPGALAIDSPTVVQGGVYWTGRDGQVWFHDGTQARQLSDDVMYVNGFEL